MKYEYSKSSRNTDQVDYITILTMNLLLHQPFSHTSRETLSIDKKKSYNCDANTNIEKVGIQREVGFHFFKTIIQGMSMMSL